MLNEVTLSLINLFTSALTAITGLGGGTILIGLLPILLPSVAIVPVHGASQLASNASRAWFGRESLDYTYFKPFLVGSLFGIAVFGLAVRYFQLELIPLFIGIYILLIQWSDTVNKWLRSLENFYLVGFIQMGLGLFVGTPGPLAIALLNKKYEDNHTVVSVGALMMSVIHGAKLPVYFSLGFAFSEYWKLMLMMIVMAIVGSLIGTRLRHIIPMPWLKKVLPWLLTLIALKLIISKVLEFGWIG
ncbi:sulfite exporter TauE/SafE family protein [Psychrobacter sp. HD31]|uniref:TSUP family transporter n=1 Tax=Psychrobacter sp. HD31 TaxID=3112003 RepID=UPI003DA36ACF